MFASAVSLARVNLLKLQLMETAKVFWHIISEMGTTGKLRSIA